MRAQLLLVPVLALAGCGSSSKGTQPTPDGGGGGPDATSRDSGGGGDDVRMRPDSPSGSDSGASGDGGGSGPKLGPTIGAFVGVDGFIVDDPTSFLPLIGNVREYHDWIWNEGNGDSSYPGYPNNQNSFVLFGGSWDWDTYYADLQKGKVFGYPAIQGGVPWLNGGAVPPVPASASVTDPTSYAAYADEMFQYAARYGATKVKTNLLQLASGQPVLTGQDTVHYIENWNEEDAWWVNADGSPVFSPEAYAAMASADRDGNQGKMGKTLGVKNADPTMKLVMGGLAGHGTSTTTWEDSCVAYIDAIASWAKTNRGGDFPADVLNVHYYSFGPSAGGTMNPMPALSPEDDHVTARMSVLQSYRAKNLPDRELWLTEFGYDTDPQSILHAPALGSNSAEVVQAQWILRYYLAVLAAGFDRAFLFVTADSCTPGTGTGTDSSCSTQFDTAGIVGVNGPSMPKTAFYYIATLRARLASYAFMPPMTGPESGVMIAKFKDTTSDKGAYVVWSPTSSATTVSSYSLAVPKATTASAVTFVDGQKTGSEATLTVSSGHVTLDVSETPTIVLVDQIP